MPPVPFREFFVYQLVYVAIIKSSYLVMLMMDVARMPFIDIKKDNNNLFTLYKNTHINIYRQVYITYRDTGMQK